MYLPISNKYLIETKPKNSIDTSVLFEASKSLSANYPLTIIENLHIAITILYHSEHRAHFTSAEIHLNI